jgi:hypothetical protein
LNEYPRQVACAKLAINREIEHCQPADIRNLLPGATRPDFRKPQRRFTLSKLAFVQRYSGTCGAFLRLHDDLLPILKGDPACASTGAHRHKTLHISREMPYAKCVSEAFLSRGCPLSFKELNVMKIKKIPVLVCALLVANVAFADELHDKAMAATHDLQQSIAEMHVIQQEHGGEFGGHMARAEQLAQQAEHERAEALKYYRERHPGWQ